MPRPKGYKDPRYSDDSIRRTGKRLPHVSERYAKLLDIIIEFRGGKKQDHIEMALLQYASEEELAVLDKDT